jgi:hypothetical protein
MRKEYFQVHTHTHTLQASQITLLHKSWNANIEMWQTICYIRVKHRLPQRYTYPGCQVAWATEFCEQLPNICGSSAWNLFHVTLLAPTIFRWLLKPCGPLGYQQVAGHYFL